MIQNGVAKKSEPIVPRIEFRHVSLAYDDQVVLGGGKLCRLARRVEIDAG